MERVSSKNHLQTISDKQKKNGIMEGKTNYHLICDNYTRYPVITFVGT